MTVSEEDGAVAVVAVAPNGFVGGAGGLFGVARNGLLAGAGSTGSPFCAFAARSIRSAGAGDARSDSSGTHSTSRALIFAIACLNAP